MILPSYYLPPISWFAAARRSPHEALSCGGNAVITIEQWEHFQKQTLRNRAYIDSPGGRQALTVPIDKSNFSAGGKCLMKDIRISRQLDWRRQHWHALESSYFNSPFFEFLQDDFRPLYEREWTWLLDLNTALTEQCLSLLGWEGQLQSTADYCGLSEFHGFIEEKASSAQRQYYQVFKEKHPFLRDLSIVDLLFNMGNEAGAYL